MFAAVTRGRFRIRVGQTFVMAIESASGGILALASGFEFVREDRNVLH